VPIPSNAESDLRRPAIFDLTVSRSRHRGRAAGRRSPGPSAAAGATVAILPAHANRLEESAATADASPCSSAT